MATKEMKLTLVIHLFKGKETSPVVEEWVKVADVNDPPNPLCLQAVGGADEDRIYLFSMEEYAEGWYAKYHPYAVHEKQKMMDDLSKFGFDRTRT